MKYIVYILRLLHKHLTSFRNLRQCDLRTLRAYLTNGACMAIDKRNIRTANFVYLLLSNMYSIIDDPT